VAHGRRTSETLRQVAPDLDARVEAAALDALEEVETRGLAPVPGASRLVQQLPADRWAIVTSGSRAVARVRLASAVLSVPRVLVTGDAVRRGKPDPEGYATAARLLGVAASDCVVVEDAPAGVAAGKAAGMRVIAVSSTHSPADLGAADVVLARLADLELRPSEPGTEGLVLEMNLEPVVTQLRALLATPDDRARTGRLAAELIRSTGSYRWVGLYDVQGEEIAAFAWTGPEAPAHPRFPATQGLNGAAVRTRAPVVVQDVSRDPRYLTTFGSTRAEAIFPISDPATGQVLGTLDVESERVDAFTAADHALLGTCAETLLPLWRDR